MPAQANGAMTPLTNAFAPPQTRSLEIYRFLGLLPDLQRLGGPLLPMRAYALPGGTVPTRTWYIVETPAPTPDRPYVRPRARARCRER